MRGHKHGACAMRSSGYVAAAADCRLRITCSATFDFLDTNKYIQKTHTPSAIRDTLHAALIVLKSALPRSLWIPTTPCRHMLPQPTPRRQHVSTDNGAIAALVASGGSSVARQLDESLAGGTDPRYFHNSPCERVGVRTRTAAIGRGVELSDLGDPF